MFFKFSRLAASGRRSRSRSVRRFVAALSLAPGSPPSVSGGGKGSLCDLRAAAKTLCATFGGALARARFAASVRRSRSRPVRRFGAAVSGGGKDFLCDLSAALSLALGSRSCSKPCSKKRPRSFLSTGGFFRIISRVFGKKRVILF